MLHLSLYQEKEIRETYLRGCKMRNSRLEKCIYRRFFDFSSDNLSLVIPNKIR